MDRPDEHLRHAGQIAQDLTGPGDDALLEFGGSLVGERERDDVARSEGAGATGRIAPQALIQGRGCVPACPDV